jgi:hypothetical protein
MRLMAEQGKGGYKSPVDGLELLWVPVGVVVIALSLGWVTAWLMNSTPTVEPAHLLSASTLSRLAAQGMPGIWGVSPDPGVWFDLSYGLVVIALISLGHLGWQWWDQRKAKSNSQYVPMRQLDLAHIRTLIVGGGFVAPLTVWLGAVVVSWIVLGDFIGALVLGTCLGAELALHLAYQLAGGPASVKLPKDRFVLGRRDGSFVVSPSQQSVMVIATQRSGKSTSVLIPNLLHLDTHSVVFTSTRQDLLLAVEKHRQAVGTIYLYDPRHAVDVPPGVKRISWTPISGCQNMEVAQRHADEFTNGLSSDIKSGGFFETAAGLILSVAFHLAAENKIGLEEIPEWVQENGLETMNALSQSSNPAIQSRLRGLNKGNSLAEVQGTANTSTKLFTIPGLIAVPEPGDVAFDPVEFLAGPNALAIIAPTDMGVSLKPLVTSLLTDIHSAMRTITDKRADGRLPVPCAWLLDEFSALGGMKSMPQIASTAEGSGLKILIAMQSFPALRSIYSEAQSATFPDLFGVKLIGRGSSNAETNEALARMVGADNALIAKSDKSRKALKGDRLQPEEIAAIKSYSWYMIPQSDTKELHPLKIQGLTESDPKNRRLGRLLSPFRELAEGIDPSQATPLGRFRTRIAAARARRTPDLGATGNSRGTSERREAAAAEPSNGTTPDLRATLSSEATSATEELMAAEWTAIESPVAAALKTAFTGARGALKRLASARRPGSSPQVSVQSIRPHVAANGLSQRKSSEDGTGVGRAAVDMDELVAWSTDEEESDGVMALSVSAVDGLPLSDGEDDKWLSFSPYPDRGPISEPKPSPRSVGVATTPQPPARRVTNQKVTACDRCIKVVMPGQGYVWKAKDSTNWLGRHTDCPTPLAPRPAGLPLGVAENTVLRRCKACKQNCGEGEGWTWRPEVGAAWRVVHKTCSSVKLN